jgi:hypothetical protein
MAPTATTRRTATKPAPEPEVVEDEFDEDMEDETEVEADEDDLEELDEDPEPEAAPAKGKAKSTKAATPKAPAKPTIEYGSPWLAAYVTENTTETYDARAIRMLLRKLAKDGALDREVGITRERYNFSGPKDPTVVAVLEMIKSGAAKELKQAGLQAVKDKAAAKKAEAAKAKAETQPEPDEMDDEDVEEAPAPAPKRRATKAAAPAKATPATTRRRTAQTAK